MILRIVVDGGMKQQLNCYHIVGLGDCKVERRPSGRKLLTERGFRHKEREGREAI